MEIEKQVADFKEDLDKFRKNYKVDDATSPTTKMGFIFWISCIIAFIYSNILIAISGYVLFLILDHFFVDPTRKANKRLIELKEIEIKKKIELLQSNPVLRGSLTNVIPREKNPLSKKLENTKYISINDDFSVNENINRIEEISVNPIPPEKKYSNPRKIDWDSINQKRKIIGLKGEEIVLEIEKNYLISINRKDLADKVMHIAVEKGDGYGCDILSFTGDGLEKYIEVKSTTNSFNSSFYISKNELDFLKNHPTNAFIYRLIALDNEPFLKVYTAGEILNSNQITPVQYIVKMD